VLGGTSRGLAEQVGLQRRGGVTLEAPDGGARTPDTVGAGSLGAGSLDAGTSGTAPPRHLGWLSLDEKAALTGGADVWHTVAVDRLGVPSLRLTDGPAGVRGTRFSGEPTVCIPCGTALGATWDRDLVRQVGRLLGDQARSKRAHVLLAPMVNLQRHPLAGRGFECFSEDPFLTAQLASAFVRGVQERGVGCAVKHFVANEQEHERTQISVEVDERTLRELYLVPFESVVRSAGAWAVMTAYNRLNGVHCSEHPGLLDQLLRKEWGFDGVVLSDWFGTHSTTALAAGLDLEMPGPPRFLGHYAAAAVRQGDVPAEALDRSSTAMLTLAERVGLPGLPGQPEGRGEPPEPAERPEPGEPGESAEELARRAAREAIVLLRNDGLLPLDASRTGTVAVLGPKAARPDVQGQGSSHVQPQRIVTPQQAIARQVQVVHEVGVAQRPPAPLGTYELRVPGRDEPGVLVEYFAGPEIAGPPVHREVVPETHLFWMEPPLPGVLGGPAGSELSVRATAVLTADRSGPWRFALSSTGRSRCLLDGAVVVDNLQPERGSTFYGRGSTEVEGDVELVAGGEHQLVVELHARITAAVSITGVNLDARPPPDPDALLRAVVAAQAADVAVIVVGATSSDGEGRDRAGLELPDDQVRLIRAVAAANPATVVVLDTGGPVTTGWADEVAAVLQLWYPGQEGGAALADVLFGDADPGGRLPTTFPHRIEDAPAFPHYPGTEGRVRYGEGLLVGYRHYDTSDVEPRFCFGHGLSYARFAYGELEVEALPVEEPPIVATVAEPAEVADAGGPGAASDAADAGGPGATPDVAAPAGGIEGPPLVRLRVDVTNTGDRPGTEVVQVYVRDVAASVSRPEQELKEFRKLRLAPGETRAVEIDLPRRAFAFWDVTQHGWMVEPGEFEIRVGSSSRRIHRTATVHLP
jgi:beta-glucosidase